MPTVSSPTLRPSPPPARVRDRHARYELTFASTPAPFAFIDLDAMWHNAAGMLRRAGPTLPIRIASKSIRSRPLLRTILARSPRFSGLMTFTLGETLWLRDQGFSNLLLAYPTTDGDGLRVLATDDADDRPIVMVDCTEHLDMIQRAGARPSKSVRVCIDIDLSYRRAAGHIAFGPKRSPVMTPQNAASLAREISRRHDVELAGVMGYEGHIAGVGDQPPGRPLRGHALRRLQRLWIEEARTRRALLLAAIREVAPAPLVNGGGTGSLHLTSQEEGITELTAGSGFFAPALFDQYSAFRLRPAAMFVLPVVRKPSPDTATALGGGYIASGAAGADRLPLPCLPAGLRLDSMEGAGEVQTPLRGEAARHLRIGDRVYMRHAKAGELCERFNTLYLVEGGAIVDQVPTYRGEGKTFL